MSDRDAIAEIIYDFPNNMGWSNAKVAADTILAYINQHYVRLDKVVEGREIVYCDIMPDIFEAWKCKGTECSNYKLNINTGVVLLCKHGRDATVRDLIGGK